MYKKIQCLLYALNTINVKVLEENIHVYFEGRRRRESVTNFVGNNLICESKVFILLYHYTK